MLGCRERLPNVGEMEMKAQTDMGDSISRGLWANRHSHTLRWECQLPREFGSA